MEYKRSELLGSPISTVWDGVFAQVTDLIVDPQKKSVLGLLTDQWWSPVAKVIPFAAVQAWDPQGLRVAETRAMVWAKLRPEIALVLTQPNIIGQSVFFPAKDEPIGQIVDVLFEQTARVVGYTVRCCGPSQRLCFVPTAETRLRGGRMLWLNFVQSDAHQVPAADPLSPDRPGLWMQRFKHNWRSLLSTLHHPLGFSEGAAKEASKHSTTQSKDSQGKS